LTKCEHWVQVRFR